MKVAVWLLGLTTLVLTAISVYEFATIQHLEFVIQMLVGGRPN